VKSLFLRVFLWFWVAMLVMTVVLVVTSPYFTQSRSRVERWQQGAESWALERVDRVVQMVGQSGTAGLQTREPRRHGRRGSMVYVFDQKGHEVMDRDAPKPAIELALQVAASGAEEAVRRGGMHLVARPVTDPDGRLLVVVGTLHRPPRPIDLLEPKALWLRLAALALVVGLVSFALARYLARPVGVLRETTRRLGVGDLTARVGGRVAARHDEIGALARDFDAMAARLESLIGSQRRLLRDVSHELRSPLARLVVALELARDRAGERADEPLDRIEREATRLDELIGKLLLLERLESCGPDSNVLSFDLCDILNEVVDDAAFEAVAANREVLLDDCASCPLRGHPELMRSALDNVLRNAVRHTPEGTAVTATLTVEDGVAEVVVRDRGSGVPEEHLESLFDPFSRVADARERATGGAGLGLAITRRAVELHQGSVIARNHPDGGLEVRIRLRPV
jgi:two-component system sensor histidine kinase CpxA